MSSNNEKNHREPNWLVIGLICAAIAYFFFLPFIGTICIAALMAFLWYPVYRKLNKHMPATISSVVIYVISSLIIVVPICILATYAYTQTVDFAKLLSSANFSSDSFTKILNGPTVTSINNFLAPLGNKAYISASSLADIFNKLLPATLNVIAKRSTEFLSNIPHLFTAVIVYTFVFLAMLKYNKSLQKYIKQISPFDEDLSEKYINRSGLIVTASLKGQFIISFITAIASALLIGIAFNMMNFFILFLLIFTLLGMVPLGSGIVVIPIIIIQFVLGNTVPAIWSMLIYILVICNIDSVLRPHLIPKKANVIPAITTLATFCGLFYFGTLGIIYGPLIVILLLTTSDIYISTRGGNQIDSDTIDATLS
jgi:predicted PurR-regulated permease PerM